MRFSKLHGCGNDYIYINCIAENLPPADRPELARKISDRHFGIGADGLICVCSSNIADFYMDMYNADGSRGKMCGNGIRAFGKYVYESGLTNKTELLIETLSGTKKIRLKLEGDTVISVRVAMGRASFAPKDIPMLCGGDEFINKPLTIGDTTYIITALSVGNPHAVIFSESDISALKLSEIGPLFENNPIFPERVNAEFVNIIDREALKMRVWERGSGETLACGTGAAAVFAAANRLALVNDRAEIILPGGRLILEKDGEELFMTGPAEHIFDGESRL